MWVTFPLSFIQRNPGKTEGKEEHYKCSLLLVLYLKIEVIVHENAAMFSLGLY